MMEKLLFVVGVCLLASSIAEAGGEFALESPAGQMSEDQSYEHGTKAMNEGHWSEAEKAFRATAEWHGNRFEGAVYWQAYVQNKQGRQKQSIQTCEGLIAQKTQSKWRGECEALIVQSRKAAVSVDAGGEPGDSGADIKMLALNGLMQQEPDRALPIVKSILQSSSQSPKLKERALFVLAQSQSKQAQDILTGIAREKADPELQVRAIHMMAAMRGKDAAGFLNDIYRNSQEERVKDAAVDGMFISGDSTDLIRIARAEANPELKKKIIGKLSLMQGKDVSDYMVELIGK